MAPQPTKAAAAAAGPLEWQTNEAGKEYVPAQGRSGVIIRQGEETVAEALERDAKGGRDEKPKRRSIPKQRKPPAPTSVDLKKLEHELAEGLRAPSMVAVFIPDPELSAWLANHFTKQGLGGADFLARQLVTAAEYNPWLRAHLEQAVSGEAFAVKLITTFALAAAVLAYAVPPVVVLLNLPFPNTGRELLDLPARKPPIDARRNGRPETPPPAAATEAGGESAQAA